MPADLAERMGQRYTKAYEQLTGNTFTPAEPGTDAAVRIEKNLRAAGLLG